MSALLLLLLDSSFAHRLMFMGDSNTNATVTDVNYAGDPLPPNWHGMHNGTAFTSWQIDGSPGCGTMPYAVEKDLLDGAQAGWVIRQGHNGETAHTFRAGFRWDAALVDAGILGGSPNKILVYLGANDSKSELETDRYTTEMVIILEAMHTSFPSADILLIREGDGSNGIFEFLSVPTTSGPSIYEQQDALETTYAYVEVVDATGCDRVDDIHFDAASDGHGCIADLIWP